MAPNFMNRQNQSRMSPSNQPTTQNKFPGLKSQFAGNLFASKEPKSISSILFGTSVTKKLLQTRIMIAGGLVLIGIILIVLSFLL